MNDQRTLVPLFRGHEEGRTVLTPFYHVPSPLHSIFSCEFGRTLL